jgi:hypothetical protein
VAAAPRSCVYVLSRVLTDSRVSFVSVRAFVCMTGYVHERVASAEWRARCVYTVFLDI